MSANSSRLNEALSLLTQSPPGQTSQVYHDLRGILFDAESNATDKVDDAKLQSIAAVALEEYNTQQLVTATLPSNDAAVIICQAGHVPGDTSDAGAGVKRYVHPKLGKTFLFNHVKRTTSDVKDLTVADEKAEEKRKALEKALEEYVKDRYPDGVSSVFSISSAPVKAEEEDELAEKVKKAAVEDAKTPAENTAATGTEDADEKMDDETTATKEEIAEEKEEEENAVEDDPAEAVAASEAVENSTNTQTSSTTSATPPAKTTFAIHHVGNRFNLSNFWSGCWRASYTLDPTVSPSTLTSTLSVQVHYFENGNVQLNAAKPCTFHLTSDGDDAEKLAKEVVKVIAAHEDGWQKGLEESYDELAERAFKALRRQLPLTRQKIDWDKVLNYKLGDELSRA
ncbi:related to CAP1 - F-actin capping protein alpha subunit [Ustilago sp. UG-2017a]|nr:related to CAP1 - F-actin capping protein alpha subunit [Ustilago sp. UG-2017a]